MDKEQLSRIAHMEELYMQLRAEVEKLRQGTEMNAALADKFEELEQYYQSPQWLADYDADREGKLPKDMIRGVLSEDAIYNLLMEKDEILK